MQPTQMGQTGKWPPMREYPKGLILSALILSFSLFAASSAAASSTPSVAWSKKDMTTAVRGLGYPKPHSKRLVCKGLGASAGGRHTAYRCVATYTHRRHRRFVIGGEAMGGWLCGGKKLASCAPLKHGFVTNTQLSQDDLGELSAAAGFASRGYLQMKYRVSTTYPKGSCSQAGASAWSCPYNWTNDSTMTVTVSFKHAKGGYAISATASQ